MEEPLIFPFFASGTWRNTQVSSSFGENVWVAACIGGFPQHTPALTVPRENVELEAHILMARHQLEPVVR